MNIIKSVCECKNLSEEDLVVAVQRNRFFFIEYWSVWIWVGVVLMTLFTGGFWLLVILGYHYKEIINPDYYCSQCQRDIELKQFRV